MSNVDISIVLCTYNRAKMLREALETLSCQETGGKFSYEILVIDDGSTDETRDVIGEVARHSAVHVRHVEEEGKGYTQVMNRGVSESRGEWVAFFDDDQLAAADWLKELFCVAVEKDAPLVGGSRVLAMSDADLAKLGPISRAHLGEQRPPSGEAQRRHSRPLPGGGNLLVKRAVFDSVGTFDISMHAGGCDRDLVQRALAAGFEVWWTPKAVVGHVIPAYRLKADYLNLVALRYGTNAAYVDRKLFGRLGMVVRCIARIGAALLMTVPRLLIAYVARNQPGTLDWQLKLLQAVSYARVTLNLLAPKMFAQERFFGLLHFRAERGHFGQSTGAQG